MLNRIFFVILLTAFLSACSSTKEKQDTASVEDHGTSSRTTETDGTGAQTYRTGPDAATSMSALEDPQSPLSVRIIYFDYDSTEIQPQFRPTLEAHATLLAANSNATLSLEGHADERGSREYNLALGERRSIAVKRLLQLLGASPSQIRAISYGEERPAVDGHDESSWSQNRRVELIY